MVYIYIHIFLGIKAREKDEEVNAMAKLQACKEQYELDIARQTHCCSLSRIDDTHRAANRKVFEKLLQCQAEIDAKGHLAYRVDVIDTKKKQKEGVVTYPEGLVIESPRRLRQVLPIPDIHKISDCDTIYRFLIARRMDAAQAVVDILHYIGFREKYNVDGLLWDREVESMFNGLDGEELLQSVMAEMAKKGLQSAAKKPVKISRPLLQPGWASWNCGVDKTGHVVLFQRPNPKELAMLEKRWPYAEGEYDYRNPDFHSVTPPYSNLLVRLYLRVLEKGRRLSRLLNYKNQHILREGLKIGVSSEAPSDFMDNGGGVTCLTDVGMVKVSHLTSSKYKKALSVFRYVSLLGQSFYPENMNLMIIVNGGFMFNMIYKLVRLWLDPQTQKKLVLLSATNRASVDELNDTASPVSATPSAHDGDDDSEDESIPPSAENDTRNFALRQALSEYIDDAFIPSWYGGKLAAVDAPLCYGSAPPKHLVSNPCFDLACERLKAKVMPELLPDDLIFANADEGEPVGEEEWQRYCEATRKVFFRSAR